MKLRRAVFRHATAGYLGTIAVGTFEIVGDDIACSIGRLFGEGSRTQEQRNAKSDAHKRAFHDG